MTQEQSFTSLVQKGPSNRSAETIALGRRLTEELGLQDGCDTTAKWMAHYLADLMQEAEQEAEPDRRRVLQDRCCEVVERLWAKRSDLPGSAKPLGSVEEALRAVERMQAEFRKFPTMVRSASKETQNPWLTFACESYAIDHRMASIAFLNGYLESRLGRERRWIKENGAKLSTQERKLIESLDKWLKSTTEQFSEQKRCSVVSKPPEQREREILADLNRAIRAQADAFRQLKSQVKPNTQKKSSKRVARGAKKKR